MIRRWVASFSVKLNIDLVLQVQALEKERGLDLSRRCLKASRFDLHDLRAKFYLN